MVGERTGCRSLCSLQSCRGDGEKDLLYNGLSNCHCGQTVGPAHPEVRLLSGGRGSWGLDTRVSALSEKCRTWASGSPPQVGQSSAHLFQLF